MPAQPFNSSLSLSARRWLIGILGAVGGSAVAWILVGLSWVQFDSLLPAFVSTLILASVGLWLCWKHRQWGFGLGLAITAVLAMLAFSVLSSGPAIP